MSSHDCVIKPNDPALSIQIDQSLWKAFRNALPKKYLIRLPGSTTRHAIPLWSGWPQFYHHMEFVAMLNVGSLSRLGRYSMQLLVASRVSVPKPRGSPTKGFCHQLFVAADKHVHAASRNFLRWSAACIFTRRHRFRLLESWEVGLKKRAVSLGTLALLAWYYENI
jgi:hypothetical protein